MTPESVLDHHLACFDKGDLDGILSDYAEASSLILPDGKVLRGPAAMRPIFKALFAEFSKAVSFDMKAKVVVDDVAFIAWSAETTANVYELGSDTFVIKGGKIIAQTFAAKIVPK